MHHCPSCRLELPDNVSFCTNCGYAANAATEMPRSNGKSSVGLLSSYTRTLISSSPQIVPVSNGAGQGSNNGDKWSEREGQRLSMPGPPVGSTVAPQGRAPVANVPMAQGRPQASGVAIASQSPQPRSSRKMHLGTWLTLAFVAAIILSGIIGGFSLVFSPTISLNGNSSIVISGETLHVHGGNFIPGSSVMLTLDGRVPVSSGNSVHAGLSGTFDVAIVVQQSWSLGVHTLRATESISRQSAVLRFVISPKSTNLAVNPTSLDFGTLKKGSRATLAVTISNESQQPLSWMVDIGTADWLTLDMKSGTLQASDSQTIRVTAHTRGLKTGNYSATLGISSNSENLQVLVALTVTSASLTAVPSATGTPSPTATSTLGLPNLLVSPSSFKATDCSYDVRQGWACNAMLSNDQNAQSDLAWSVSVSNNGGISGIGFSQTSGILLPGQKVQVTIYIPDAPCPANVAITYAGPANSVHEQWSCGAPTLMVSPNAFNVPGDSNCSLSSNVWKCTVKLSNADQGELQWTASGGTGVTFSSSRGTLHTGQTVNVIVSIPNHCGNLSLSFSGPANKVTVSVTCA